MSVKCAADDEITSISLLEDDTQKILEMTFNKGCGLLKNLISQNRLDIMEIVDMDTEMTDWLAVLNELKKPEEVPLFTFTHIYSPLFTFTHLYTPLFTIILMGCLIFLVEKILFWFLSVYFSCIIFVFFYFSIFSHPLFHYSITPLLHYPTIPPFFYSTSRHRLKRGAIICYKKMRRRKSNCCT